MLYKSTHFLYDAIIKLYFAFLVLANAFEIFLFSLLKGYSVMMLSFEWFILLFSFPKINQFLCYMLVKYGNT